MFIVRNDFHNTAYTLNAKVGDRLSNRQISACRKALCGMSDCRCAEGPLGNRKPQSFAYDCGIDNDGREWVKITSAANRFERMAAEDLAALADDHEDDRYEDLGDAAYGREE